MHAILSKNSICLRVRQLATKVWHTEKSTARTVQELEQGIIATDLGLFASSILLELGGLFRSLGETYLHA